MAHSTAAGKAKKPRPDFPLWKHPSGRWCKKIRGRFIYFGKVADDPKGEAALEVWLSQKDDWLAGRTPRSTPADGLTLRELCNQYCSAQELKRDAGRITHRSFLDSLATSKLIINAFGLHRLVDDLTPQDFDALYARLVKRKYSLNTQANIVRRVRGLFMYAFKNGLTEKPLRFGTVFVAPRKELFELQREDFALKHGPRAFTAAELRTVIKRASQPLRAMILLGINTGMGNEDIGRLPTSALNLDAQLVEFRRTKNGTKRRCFLWPKTVASIQESLETRPQPKDATSDAVFITKYGHPWATKTQHGPISKEMTKHLRNIGIYRPGLSFYSLRRTFESVAGGIRDQVAVDFLMGHNDQTMAARYREYIEDGRLRAVVEHVRQWLFGTEDGK